MGKCRKQNFFMSHLAFQGHKCFICIHIHKTVQTSKKSLVLRSVPFSDVSRNGTQNKRPKTKLVRTLFRFRILDFHCSVCNRVKQNILNEQILKTSFFQLVSQTESYTASCTGPSSDFIRRESSAISHPDSFNPNSQFFEVSKSEAYLWGSNSSHQLAEGTQEKILAPKLTTSFQDVQKVRCRTLLIPLYSTLYPLPSMP